MKPKWSYSLIALIASYLVLFFFLKDHLFHPNDYVFAFGGDAAIIYYNMIFHTLYGEGLHLSNMNYPMGESLLMTDAQASISFILNKLNSVSWVRGNVVGIMHGFHYLCLGLAVVFFQRALRKLDVQIWLSIIGALLIVYMSPQMFRLRCGHFGLAYPLMFAAVCYGLISLGQMGSTIGRFGRLKYQALIFFSLLFFGINNIYLLVLATGLAVLFLLFKWRFSKEPILFSSGLACILPLALTFILIKWTDPGMDRLKIQWGYYTNRTTWEGLTTGFTSLIGTFSGKMKGNIENVSNIGIVNIAVILVLIVNSILPKGRKKIKDFFKTQKLALALLSASVVVGIYATGWLKPLAEAIPAATMFKASGRFAWPFYYCISMVSLVFINRYIKKEFLKENKILMLVSFLALFVWTAECYNYLNSHIRFKQYDNPYSQKKLNKLSEDILSENIDPSRYQALYALPLMEAWNDKFRYKIPWNTEFFSSRISMATGLPMINAMISRIGLTQAGAAVQMVSHPWIQRSILNQLDDRPILLVLGTNNELSEGEQWLVDRADLRMERKEFKLYEVLPSQLAVDEPQDCSMAKPPLYQNSFESLFTENSFYGDGALVLSDDQKSHLILDYELEDSLANDRFLEISFWVHTTARKYGMPWLRLEELGVDGGKINTDHVDIAASKDVSKNWRKATHRFQAKENTRKVQIYLDRINQSFTIDEILLRSVGDTICHQLANQQKAYLRNNYLLTKGN